MVKKKTVTRKNAVKEELIPIRALGTLRVPIIGKATEAEVTQAEFDRLREIKVNDEFYIERR